MAPPTRVLFVCTANYCRSPLAECLLRARAAELGMADAVLADSAGISDWFAGEPPDPRACAVAADHGIDLGGLRARAVTEEDFAANDLVLGMTRDHLDALHALRPPDARAELGLLLGYAAGPAGLEIADPFGGTAADFARAFAEIDAGVRGLLAFLRARHLRQ